MSEALTNLFIAVALTSLCTAVIAVTVRRCGEDVRVVRHLPNLERVVRIESMSGDVSYASETWACVEFRCKYWRTGVYYDEAYALGIQDEQADP